MEWQPYGCDLPRFNAIDFLERSRNGRILFAGDSIGKNLCESLICMLAQAVSNQSTIFKENNSPITEQKGISFHQVLGLQPYRQILQNTVPGYHQSSTKTFTNRPAGVRVTIRVAKLYWYSNRRMGANLLVFNTGHWWNKDKTVKMVSEVSANIQVMNNKEFKPIQEPSFSPQICATSLQCDAEMEPEKNYAKTKAEPWNNQCMADVIKQMKYGNWKVQWLNIEYLTELRKNGHPSTHHEPSTPSDAPQDCSRWCLPGIPDAWNELLYAHLLLMGFRTK
ncbi:hypothetical protein DITRI_Ditri06bG0040000 [Diplodiscus trichospermus]